MVAGPYTSGTSDPELRATNLQAMNEAAHEVWKRGHVPVIGVNMALPVIAEAGREHFDAIMMPLSLALAERCDAVLRIGGPSNGADQEVALIRSKGGQVFTRVEEIEPHPSTSSG
ncbi:MAG: DUF4406 domain-containing protein [Alphaproteobacteria bacterium]|nr:DUF4406 domain-containing protein [Alphaproteobacteria bacterium]